MRLLSRPLMATLAVAPLLAGSVLTGPVPSAGAGGLPPVRHLFVIELENQGYATTFGPNSPAPYLAGTLTAQGALLSQYYGIGHESLPNYIAEISGQAPNPVTQDDCQNYVNVAPGVINQGQAVGQGCVEPAGVPTVADQFTATHRRWKGYMEDMGNDPVRDNGTACAHPVPDTQDQTQKAEAPSPAVPQGDAYATRHDPFMYFHSITDNVASCQRHVVPLTALQHDLASASATPNLSFITPNLCDDGHDRPCADGRPGGLVSADAFLQTWVPRITASPAYRRDGALVILFDEAPLSDASACCGEPTGPNTPMPGITGPGGGRVGAVVLSRYVRPGTQVATAYNHYSLLGSIEDLFGLGRLGYAAGAPTFGSDVWTAA